MSQYREYSNSFGPQVLTNRVVANESAWDKVSNWENESSMWKNKTLVYCGNLCDVFEDHNMISEARARLWDLIENTPNLKWMIITKRPENINEFVPPSWRIVPPENAWFGVSVENHETAIERIRALQYVNSVLKIVCYEPAIAPVRWSEIDPSFDWLIVGGEIGENARPMLPAWALMAEAWTRCNGIPLFVKQMGSAWYRKVREAGEDGGNIHTFPAKLQVREHPVRVWE